MLLKYYSKENLMLLEKKLSTEYESFKKMGFKLDISRGKPGSDQLAVSNGLLDAISSADWEQQHLLDYRNYGLLMGIKECRQMFADLLDVNPDNVIVCGNSSLNMMFDYITQCMLSGAGDGPWFGRKIKFLCPVPGYDRHFSICQYYGIEMINIPMGKEGPDVDMIEEYIQDESVKGMFCVPKYSNPTGVTFSEDTVKRIAALKPAAKDFRIIWDNAYIIHDFSDRGDNLYNIFDALKLYGNEDMVIEFTSTSKISFPGAGVAALAASTKNIEMIRSRMTIQTIGYDKLNQYRHVKFYRNANGLKKHMILHRAILAPKFKAVTDKLEEKLGSYGIASWSKPNGGYFINFNVMPGTAKEVGRLCREAGVVLTDVGATFPYGIDPNDSNIRIAPSYPPVDELMNATRLLCLCTLLAAVRKLLNEK
ncbi:MAG: aminotransferase class I/II-fold pyridoxal phosphate-dependent enzyme [Clostridia bacterium]|nr:aminotransferase class I/II-fold pyridoxal phosphate-dependent enzyme [Clostridia bacterium]